MPRDSEPLETGKRYRKSGVDQFVKYVRDLPLPSPRQIHARLEELGYRGQDEARRAVSLMAYRHVRRIKRIHLDGVRRELLLPKQNFLLLGPTGSGKTHLVELLFRHILRLPTILVDITTYSETGYVGQDPSSIITRLLHAADDNPLLASIGIVCLDEFDKIASGQNSAFFSGSGSGAGAGTTKDVTGMGVQRELLKMLEASDVVVPLELGHANYGDHVVMSTADIAFIAAGAFSGFQHVARRRRVGESLGFGRTPGPPPPPPDQIAVSYTAEEVDDVASFQAYGFLPELMARFTRVVPFSALSAETLKEILRASVIDRLVREFDDEGFRLTVTEEVLDHVVAESVRRQTGARGLAAILTRHVEALAFDVFAEPPPGHGGPPGASGSSPLPVGDVRLELRDGQIEARLG